MAGPYEVQGIPFSALCQEFGAPLYVYDAEKIRRQYDRLRAAFSVPVQVKYAAKALTNVAVLQLFRRWGAGLDTVSLNEVELGLRAGFAPQDIIYTPNGVSFDEIKAAVAKGVVVNVDSLPAVERFGHEYGGSVPCCIRLNPHILAGGTHHLQTGHIDSKFGISVYQLRHLQRIVRTYGIKVSGLHMHTGSEILDAGVFLAGAEILFDAARELPDLQFMDFGSGFKIAYKEGDVVTDVPDLGRRMSASFREFCASYGRPLELWFEPGKFLVSEAGYFLVRVNAVKQTVSTVFAQVDSGANHLIRPMYYDAYHRIENVTNAGGTPRVYTVVGYICETDTFGWDRPLSEVREGDILCFFNAGAYGYEMASNYNSRPRPAEVLVVDGRARLIRRRETLEDLVRNQVPLDAAD